MSYGVKLRVWGDYACFTRPEMKVERVSYDALTPSAARGIIEAIYWQHAIRWVIDRIHVLRPIRFTNIRRNEVGCKLSEREVNAAINGGKPPSIFIEVERQQRAAMILLDVEYVIEAHYDFSDAPDDNPGRHFCIFTRRARDGQCFHQPVLGCREFPAHFELVEGDIVTSPITGTRELGWMLHDIDFAHEAKPRFFRAVMENGVITVPPFMSEEVKG
jgi:CRISPR-associated protein Cas5d